MKRFAPARAASRPFVRVLLLALLAGLGVGCRQGDSMTLADRLMDLGYLELFQRLDDNEVQTIWQERGAPQRLAALALDEAAPLEGRWLAAEILFKQDPTYPPEEAKEVLARLYAARLAEAQWGNVWALPGFHNGPAGDHIMALGESAVPHLLPLLGVDKVLLYEGSKEATVGNHYAFRVKDVAAYLLSQIRGIPLEMEEEPAARDAAIEPLRAAL